MVIGLREQQDHVARDQIYIYISIDREKFLLQKAPHWRMHAAASKRARAGGATTDQQQVV